MSLSSTIVLLQAGVSDFPAVCRLCWSQFRCASGDGPVLLCFQVLSTESGVCGLPGTVGECRDLSIPQHVDHAAHRIRNRLTGHSCRSPESRQSCRPPGDTWHSGDGQHGCHPPEFAARPELRKLVLPRRPYCAKRVRLLRRSALSTKTAGGR